MTDDSIENKKLNVAVLIGEDFFRERTFGAITALAANPMAFGYSDTLLDELVAAKPIGIVIDLEDEGFSGLSVVAAIRATPELAEVPYVAYAAFDREDIIVSAEALGVNLVMRSVYAAELVKRIQGFLPADEGDSDE
ncbi:MAG: CheY-like chemotaxis protein [Myxococcota bacterium]|jgi:CheY-like chemotaxis protein